MQHHSRDDPYEREPLDASRDLYNNTPPRPPPHGYSPPADEYYDPTPSRAHHPTAHPDSAFNRMPPQENYSHSDRSYNSGGSGGYDQPRNNMPTSQNYDNGYYRGGRPSGDSSSAEGFHSAGQVPPPPSRTQMPQQAYSSPSNGGYVYDSGYGNHGYDQVSNNSATGVGAAAFPLGTRSSPSSNFAPDPYADDPYRGLNSRHGNNLGVVNPNEIEDDGDDGLHYHKQSQRNSMLSLSHSDRTPKQAIGTATAVGAGAGGGLLRKGYQGGSEYDLGTQPEKSSDWKSKQQSKSKKWKWVVIILVFLVIVGAIVGGVVGGMMSGRRSGGSENKGQSASDDSKQNGDLDKNSAEIKALMNNANLHRVFPGMDYTPLNTQYPDCLHNPPSQNNITRDVAVLSQLTNKIRLYGTDCNQTEMLVHAIDKLDLKDDVKIWLGVWQDNNETTNARQLEQMWTILDDYGAEPFEGIIVANEILFRKEMTITQLGTVLDGVRKNLTEKSITLPVATSDLGDDWTTALADDSDYIMANIHPFFAGVEASDAAAWTYNFWETKNKPMWKSDQSKNIISETGWPTAGGKSCGAATTCTTGSVAGIDELNQFMSDWVCEALTNGTNYFWFEAFDEPWKGPRFNVPGKEWEDQWGLLTVNRKLKDGVKIPDCGGKTVS